ncbi:ABC transporter ATP-binding protein [Chelatococcus sambhunathii]|uniref:ABC transporter ATP-binding protein n=1 Tax=Chelatococcus sambhunathii TaxID=363953 RepID=A0ABU1DHP9_9HYPH|nr:ABC transporter ATP-binding protein [Chelatococcus sambhunathii]MDR4307612.1 ABC transporter ATP-binding protein [Chelatococcus sambhunathii]
MIAASTALLEVRNLAKRFGGLAALDGCSLALEAGQITGLIGPNGAGKSTLLNVMTGLVRADQGSVLLDGRDVTTVSSHRFPALGVARTFQIVRELSSLTVFENLLLAPRLQSGEGVVASLFARRKWWAEEQANAQKAKALLDRVGLFRLADHPSGGLSGGQKKLLDLARALLLEPKLILLDEPGAGVAPPLKLEMIRLIRELKAEGVSFGLVEHDMHLVGELCDCVHVMAEGKRLVSGTFEAVSRDRRVVEAYLGVAA